MSGTHVLAQHANTSEESPSATEGPPLRSAMMGEFLGTALLILLGDGVVAAVVLLNKTSDKMMITTAWGLAVALAVYVCRAIERRTHQPGRDAGPGLTRGIPAHARVPLLGAQLAGAFVGALLVYADYSEAFRAFERDEHVTRGAMVNGKLAGPAAGGAGVFATYPIFDTPWRNIFSEFLGTAVLLLGVRALTDRAMRPPAVTSSRWRWGAWSGRSACRWAA